MTEKDPNQYDDTQPGQPTLPGQPGQPTQSGRPGQQRYDDEGHRHAYDPTAATRAYDPHAWGNQGWDARGWDPNAAYYSAPQQRPEPKHRSGAGFVAAVLAAALVVGGLAGFGGAAGFSALSSLTDGGSSGQDSVTSSVVDREDAPAKEGSVQEVAASVLPSVVKINVRGPQGAGSGSGVIISSDGEILTNHHVVQVAEDGGSLSVGFNDGSTAPASVVGTDPLTDLAVIKAEGVSDLTPAELGKSSNLDVGEQVVAVGSPFGLEATVTSGIVSALHRPVSISGQGSSISTAYPAIQTDAAINPGNSGGPLVNMQGEVVGINSSIRTSSSPMGGEGGSIGLGFAIPLDNVLPIVEQIRDGQTATHAQLGVTVVNAASQDGMLSGAGINGVNEGSAAAEAGVRPGDVVVAVDDHQISDATSLVASIRGHRPGDTVELTVVRDGERQTIEVTLDSDQGRPTS